MAITLFSYRRENSILHKTSAGIKILLLILLCFITFFNTQYEIQKLSGCALIPVVLFFLSKAKFKNCLKAMKQVFVLGFFMTFVKTISMDGTTLIINPNQTIEGIIFTLRFLITTLSCHLIFETTSSLQIKNSLDNGEEFISKIFPFIKKLHLADLISLCISFIPMVFETWNKVELAARSRAPEKKSITSSVMILRAEFEAMFSCLLFHAENKRKAMLNRK